MHEVKDSRYKVLRALFSSEVEGVNAFVILFIHVKVELLISSLIGMCWSLDQGLHVLVMFLNFRVRFIPYIWGNNHFRLGEILIAELSLRAKLLEWKRRQAMDILDINICNALFEVDATEVNRPHPWLVPSALATCIRSLLPDYALLFLLPVPLEYD